MEEPAPDNKPSKVLALYVPVALGVFAGAFTEPYCACELTWTQLLFAKAAGAVAFFVFWWIATAVCFHGYHFVRALFQHPG